MCAMHMLSKAVLKLNALLASADAEGFEAVLKIQDCGWNEVSRTTLDPAADTALLWM